MNYKEYNDLELLEYIKEENEEANELMFTKYMPLIKSLANKLLPKNYSKGLEQSDLIQEGMIGLSYAINSYKDNKDTSFYTYAKTCIERRMLSILKGTTRLKNKILNESLPIETDFDDIDLIDIISDDTPNPLNMIINTEQEQEIKAIANDVLTYLEFQVFELKMSGFNYKEIADILDLEPKNIDNALQRIKNKLKKKLEVNKI